MEGREEEWPASLAAAASSPTPDLQSASSRSQKVSGTSFQAPRAICCSPVSSSCSWPSRVLNTAAKASPRWLPRVADPAGRAHCS